MYHTIAVHSCSLGLLSVLPINNYYKYLPCNVSHYTDKDFKSNVVVSHIKIRCIQHDNKAGILLYYFIIFCMCLMWWI